MENSIGIAKLIAEKVKQEGGRVFYVGGYVRDRLMHRENKDVDIEVHGIAPEKLHEILAGIGEPLEYGKSFGVYSLKGYDIDIAMPRSEVNTGEGHRDFRIDVDPFIGTYKASMRRDFTINAMLEDVLSGEIVDHFGGQEDLEKGIIRCVDQKTFIEDPLRVYRACQFAARFGFAIDEETRMLCSGIDTSSLSRERVEEEMKKALLKAKRPSLFFEELRKMDQLDAFFPTVRKLIGIRQDPIYHPEGDVYVHTMEVLDRSVDYHDRVSDPYLFSLLALTHDFGKITTTFEKDGRIHSYGHEIEGLPLIRDFIRGLTTNNAVWKYLKNMVPLHMRPLSLAYDRSSIRASNRLFDEAVQPLDLIYFAFADKREVEQEVKDFLFERYEAYKEMMARPQVGGDDLIALGLKPGKQFNEILKYAHKLALSGLDKEEALKQCLSYHKKMNEK